MGEYKDNIYHVKYSQLFEYIGFDERRFYNVDKYSNTIKEGEFKGSKIDKDMPHNLHLLCILLVTIRCFTLLTVSQN